MKNTTSPMAIAMKSKRGFGLIDVSLGIIAGIGLLVGAVILFQQVNTNNAVSEVTRNAVTISSEIRSAARALPNFTALDTTATPPTAGDPWPNGTIAVANLGLEPGMTSGVSIATVGADDHFTLTFAGLPERACNRAALSSGNLGANVVSAACTAGDLVVTYRR